MGTFEGHISPGLAYLVVGVWWTVKYSWLLFSGNDLRPSTRRKNCLYWLRRLPWEGIAKLIYGIFAALMEFFWPRDHKKLQFINPKTHTVRFVGEWQHLTMYLYFSITGIADIVSHTCLQKRAISIERFFLALAFSVQALLLYYHRSHSKSELENHAHLLLLLADVGTAAFAWAIVWSQDVLLPFMMTGFAFLQGTWLLTLAFVLFKPTETAPWTPWDPEDPHNTMFLTIAFAWNIILDILLLAITFMATKAVYKRTSKYHHQNDYSTLEKELEIAQANGRKSCNNNGEL